MLDLLKIGKMTLNLATMGIYKKTLGKIRLSGYGGKICYIHFLSSKFYLCSMYRVT